MIFMCRLAIYYMKCPNLLPTFKWVVLRLSGCRYSLSSTRLWMFPPILVSVFWDVLTSTCCAAQVLSCGLRGSEAVASIPGLSALSLPHGVAQAVPPAASTLGMAVTSAGTATRPTGARSHHPLLGYLNSSWY